MTKLPNLDPELQLLLQAIADDPKAKLLRIEIPRPERLVLTGVPRIGLRAAGLTSAERELLRVHREDVAKLLRDAAEWKIQQEPLGAVTSSRYADPRIERVYPTRTALLQGLVAGAERTRGLPSCASVAESAQQGKGLLASPTASALQLAGLSLRVVAHDAAWIQIGRTLWLEGQRRAALACLCDVVRRAQAPRLQGSALTYIASIHGEARLHANAASAYAAASELLANDVNATLSWLVEAIAADDIDQAILASAHVDHTLTPESPGVQCWIAEMEARMRMNPRLLTSPRVSSVVESRIDSLGPVARRMFDALR